MEYADLDVIQLLVEHGADVNHQQFDTNGTYPLHIALSRKNDGICDYLLTQGSFINEPDIQGSTPLALAVNNEYLYMIKKLLKLGAKPNIADSNGNHFIGLDSLVK